MDLSNLEIPNTVTVHLEFPTIGKLYDGKKPVTIELYSPASDKAIEYKRKIQRAALLKMHKSRNNSVSMSPEEIEEQTVERLTVFTAAVNNLKYAGEVITPENISKVYSDPKMGWLCDQLSEKLGGWEDFLA